MDMTTQLGPLRLRSPLIAASGTVGSVVDFAEVGVLEVYGAAVAKSVSEVPWPGRTTPRLAPAGLGMLNSIGIQNPGMEAWAREVGPMIDGLPVPVWASVVGKTADEFGRVAMRLASTGVQAIEVNLSCPNLEGRGMFALDTGATQHAVAAVREAINLPVGVKLSPNASNLPDIARAATDAGADWLVLANTVWGAAIDIETRRPRLSGLIGGYSGPPVKPVAIRCVLEVREALPDVPIVGCGGVRHGDDVVEFLLAGASAVAIGTAHFERPRVGREILSQLEKYGATHGITEISSLIGGVVPW